MREKLGRAALAAILLDIPVVAHADSGPTTQLDITSLFYGEQSRAQVVEPLIRATRLYPDGQSLSAQIGFDIITGASPSGALPTGDIQTTTTASGNTVTIPAGELPMTQFRDQRIGLDGDWQKPLGRYFTSVIGGHFSREKDYQSVGFNGRLSVDLWRRLTTLTVGGGYNHDSVFPTGGTPAGLSDGTIISTNGNPKQVKTLVLGIAQVLSRRWLVGVDASRTLESGYLTEPYKLISVVDATTGIPILNLTDQRPDTHNRTSILLSSTYHFTKDILYLNYRHYWDSWDVKSNTVDVKYRHELGGDMYLEPHVRYYKQNAAGFFTFDLIDGAPLPDFATADTRLGLLKTITVGSTFGFHIGDSPGEWNARAEFIRQTGESHPADAIGVQQNFDLSPPINTFAIVVGYSLHF